MKKIRFTDIHIDKGYTEYMSSNCTLPLCCRNQPGAIKLDPTDKLAAGYWGTVGAPCDIPVRLSEHVHKWFASVEDKPDFVINTGDDPAHNVWEQSRELNSDSLDKSKGFIAISSNFGYSI